MPQARDHLGRFLQLEAPLNLPNHIGPVEFDNDRLPPGARDVRSVCLAGRLRAGALQRSETHHAPTPRTGVAGAVTLQTAPAQGAMVFGKVRQDEPLD